MRADRLLSLLLLLQSRGRMSAQALAAELEVSERTIYRDVEALSAAGIPVYGEPGREGGFALLDSYRTNLTGLTEGEVRALFMLTIPAPLTQLGFSADLRSAFLKLSAALPAARRSAEEQGRSRVHLDSSGWDSDDEPVPHLQVLFQAVQEDRRVHLTTRPLPAVQIDLLADPLGLVAKAGTWYLVCARFGRPRVYRVSDLMDVRLSSEPSLRPPGFDLAAFWQGWCAGRARQRTGYPVTIRAAPSLRPYLAMVFGSGLRTEAAAEAADGWIELRLSFESLEAARDRLLDLGGAVEVLTPKALRLSLRDYAEQIVARYATSGQL